MKHRFLLTAAILLAACEVPNDVPSMSPIPGVPAPHAHHPTAASLPTEELQRVKAVTARYHSVDQALADGYVDANIILPNMGHHYLKGALVDDKFELERPEILVYSPDADGKLKLVAVEYGVPLSLSATAPEGFEGAADVWFPNQTYQLWTLHVWLWKDNPDGVFNATNSTVP